jgi:hypothetical protein
MSAYERKSLPFGNRSIGEFQELGAAAAHLDGDVAQRGTAELESRGLAMIRTADRFQLTGRVLLKFVD